MAPSEYKKPTDSLNHNLDQIKELLDKQRLVENLVHHQRPSQNEIVESLVHRQHSVELRSRLKKLHVADIADLLEALPLDDRRLIWQHLSNADAAEVLMEVSDPVRANLIDSTDDKTLLAILHCLDADDIAYITEDIPEPVLAERLKSFDTTDKDWLDSAKTYPEDTVGYLMSKEMVTVRQHQTLEQAQFHLRQVKELPIHNDKLFVLDGRGVLTGVLSIQTILLSEPETRVVDVMAREVVRFHAYDKAQDAASAFERYDLVSAPVVNERGKLIGRLTVDLVMEFIREDTSEDVINLAGIQEEEDLFSPVLHSARNRGVWLFINLLTAFVSASIISVFEHTILQLVALAALMPIIGSVGGNTGNQTTVLIIRGIALGTITRDNRWRLLKKELWISLLNGTVLGLMVGVFAYAIYQNVPLSVVISVAMALTFLFAASLGFSVPLLLKKFGRDPALGSSVLMTALTDSLAFFIFLGMATVFLL
ncbi:MAG: magnesium transporter [Gammaproteobacteria bacterium]|nr:magnesium transporter [Gammaproteobacteria bacterium]